MIEKDETWTKLYNELKRLAHYQLRNKPQATLSPTVLVHETYLKMVNTSDLKVNDKNHLIALCCRAMRQVLVSRHREKAALKRGENAMLVTLEENLPQDVIGQVDLLALEEVLEKLEAVEPRLTQIVEMRFFGGLTNLEIADHLQVTSRTVERQWTKAKVMLFGMLNQK